LQSPRYANDEEVAIKQWRARRGFCSFLYIHDSPPRKTLREKLERASGIKIEKLHGEGRYGWNIYDEAVTIQQEYRFGIAAESRYDDDYLTEKLMNAFLAGTIPIYSGALNVAKYFNKKAFINVRSRTARHVHTHTHTHTHTLRHPNIEIHCA